jgi:Tfp pilus assembly protein PilV
MQRLKNALRDRRGETIVEVLVAFVLLMLFLALFTASLRFARRASAQAQTTRDNLPKHFTRSTTMRPGGKTNPAPRPG